jgi:hypothetical protein
LGWRVKAWSTATTSPNHHHTHTDRKNNSKSEH